MDLHKHLHSLALKKTDKVFKRMVPDLSGAQVFQLYCATCHSTDGTKLIGPIFKGLAGREQITWLVAYLQSLK